MPLDIHQSFQSLPAGPLVDEYFGQQDAEGEFMKEVTRRMFDIMLELKVWSELRPSAETIKFGDKMDEKLSEIHAKEEEQERARQTLVSFIASIQTALAALQSF
ncbi:hypothetical protein FRB99_007159 [Tulasnella sp. 403]|nr:hypothetical protein FRB99_007159 [Tulasnella sp. 403]